MHVLLLLISLGFITATFKPKTWTPFHRKQELAFNFLYVCVCVCVCVFVCVHDNKQKNHSELSLYWFLGVFAQLRKETICFTMPVCPSVRPSALLSLSVHKEQHGCHWTDFYKGRYLRIFQKERNSRLIKIWQA